MDTDARILLGMMSGTSADGVDAAAVRITGRGRGMSAELLRHTHAPYEPNLRARIFKLRGDGHGSFAEYAAICRALTLVHADAAKACMDSAGLTSDDIAAIAVHGQTFFHEPPDTIQLFDPALLAWHTGCQVISDFRRADLAAGGQGAPLVPFADWLLFRHPTKHRVLLNLGGIANLTYLPAGCELEDVIAFDCGPANCLSDHIMRTRGDAAFDEGGWRAMGGECKSGVACLEMLEEFDFFSRRPPKSLDVPELIDKFEQKASAHNLFDPYLTITEHQLGFALRTANGIASQAIAEALVDIAADEPTDVIVSGGGWSNLDLRRQVIEDSQTYRLDRIRFATTADHGVPTDAKEAVAFALLGAATLDGEPSNVPSATGASRSVVLGAITPRP
ncbi:MAG: anhydro-N-acetylmuramic acid kinase [Planctomycetota bacterium]